MISKSHFTLKPDPRYKNARNGGHHNFPNKEHPVKIESDNVILRASKDKHNKSYGLEGNFLQKMGNANVKNKDSTDGYVLQEFQLQMTFEN